MRLIWLSVVLVLSLALAPLAVEAQLELPPVSWTPHRSGAERSVHDAEEPSTIPARVSGAAR